MPDFSLERAAGGLVAGVDEVGRGPLAGPVIAAAVVFTAGVSPGLAPLLDDSKRLSARQREIAYDALRAEPGVAIALAGASTTQIARLNILHASLLAMRRAVLRLPFRPDLALVDGNRAPSLPCEVRCVVGGDGVSFSIAAASIVAKVTRDRAMGRLDARYPGYGWAANAGYPTSAHRAALLRLGATPHHRIGFAGVAPKTRSGKFATHPD